MEPAGILDTYFERTRASKAALTQARRVIPGGLVQGSRHYDPYPLVIGSADGPWIIDVDGNRYVDYFQAATSQFFGNRHPAIAAAVEEQIVRGWNYGLPYELEAEVAGKLVDFLPAAEAVTFTNSGMDACLLAMRLARSVTGRVKIATFKGHFHGWEDQLYTSTGTGTGTPPEMQQHMVVLPYNDARALDAAMASEQFAAVLLEPYSTNCGAIPTDHDFLARIRELASEHGAALIFDECVTATRLAVGGAQAWFDVAPDMTVVGKSLTGGFSILGALAGRRQWLEPTDRYRAAYVYHGAWQTPVVMAAANATLDLLSDGGLITHANALGERVRAGLDNVFKKAGVPGQAIGLGSAVRIVLGDEPVRSPADLARGDQNLLLSMHLGMINGGHFTPPGRNIYTNAVQTDATVDSLLAAAESALADALNERLTA